MRIYRHSRIVNGRREESRKWYVDVRFDGRRFRIPLVENQAAAKKIADKITQLLDYKHSGDPLPAVLRQWLDQAPAPVQKRLAELGIVSQQWRTAKTDIAELLDEWHAALLAKNITRHQADILRQRVSRIFEEAGFRTPADINPHRALQAISGLQRLAVKKNPQTGKTAPTPIGAASPMSKLHHLRAVKQFCRWCCVEGRMTENPLEHLALRNVQIVKKRRALSAEELAYLIGFVETAAARAGISGQERALLYQTAAFTGLRLREIGSLTRASFDFKRGTVRVESQHTKNRRAAILPVKRDLLEKIKLHAARKLPHAALFKIPDKAAKIFKKDVEAARQQWINAAKNPDEFSERIGCDFLRVETPAGKLDFHALRHTFGSALAAAGVHPKTAMALMRHSDINLTLAHYTHETEAQKVDAIEKLPDIAAEQPAAIENQ